jgi:hypothetical protein
MMLDEKEQAALLWLLRATDNGAIVNGSELSNVMRLAAIHQRIRAKIAARPLRENSNA